MAQKKRLLVASALPACILGFAGLAHAETAGGADQPPSAPPPQAVAPPSAPPAAAPTNADASPELSEVTVTAQRRSENIERVPISITSVTAATLVNAGVTQLEGLPNLVPSLVFTSDSGYTIAFLRGIGTGITGVNEPSVATFVDGVYYSAPTAGVFDFNNIDRVEVLKGPQGTLFGRNATGGVIQVLTLDPSSTPALNASIGYGNYETTQANLYATTGIAPNLAADFGLYYNDQAEGWGFDPTTHKQVNKSNDIELRSKWKWTPVDGTKIILAADYGHDAGDIGINEMILPGTTGQGGFKYAGFYNTLSNTRNGNDTRQWGGSLTVNQELGSMQLVSISAYRNTWFHVNYDQDATPLNIVAADWTQPIKAFSQELQLLSSTNQRLQWMIGGYLFDQDSGWLPFNLRGAAAAPLNVLTYNFDDKLLSLAGFGQATYEIIDGTKLTLGARYTSDRHHDNGTIAGDGSLIVSAKPRATFSQPTWRVSLDHQFTPDVLGYISYNRGFKGGVFNQLDFTGPPVKPEVIDAYEIGSKTTLWRRVRFNIAGYYYNYHNVQVQTLEAGLPVWLNAAAAKIYGADADLTYKVTDDFQLIASSGYIHGRYTNFPGYTSYVPVASGGAQAVVIDASGQQTVRSPTFSGNLTADYDVRTRFGRFDFSGTYAHSTPYTWLPDGRLKQPTTNLLNGSITWTHPSSRYDIRLWGKNLTNQRYFDNEDSDALGYFGRAAAPLTYGVTFGVHY